MKSVMKNILVYLGVVIASVVAVTVLGNLVLLTIFNAIFGSDNSLVPTVICMGILSAGTVLVFAYKSKDKDTETKRRYLAGMEGKEYASAEDLRMVLRDKQYLGECISVCVVFIIMAIWGNWITTVVYLLAAIAFPIFNCLTTMHYHKSWANDRLRK